MTRRDELAASLEALEARLAVACSAGGRERHDVHLVAVSKTHPVEDVVDLAGLGVRDFGENRDQEAAPKVAAYAAAGGPPVRWHFVGGLQTNKARSVAAYADVVHSVDRGPLVRALSTGAVRADREIDVLLQVSLDGDPERGGVLVVDVLALADHAAAAPGLRLAGVMAVAPLGADPSGAFATLADVASRVRAEHPDATAVSAGMSGDLEEAIAAGATYVRVGTALFGPRPPTLR